MKPLIAFALFLTLLFTTFAAESTSCPQNPARDLIQTGLIEFANTKHRQSCQQISVTYQIPNSKLQIAASVVSTQNYRIVNGLDYAIKVSPKPINNLFVATLLSDFNANWTKITVSYIATSRNDLLLGSFLTDSLQTLTCIESKQSDRNVMPVSNVIADWNPDFLSAKPIVYISGIKTISSQIKSLKIATVSLNASGILKLQIESSSGLQIEFIQLSYILVSQSFPLQHGYELNHPEYSLPVFQEFSDNNLVQVKWGIYTGSLICEGASCTKKCLTKDECKTSLGNQLNGHCYVCSKGTAWKAQKCVSVCGNNEFWNGDSCSCVSNAIRVKSACVPCAPNSIPDKNQKECICNTGFIWSNWTSTCLSFTCPVNSQAKVTEKGVDCVCKLGFYKESSSCKKIPDCPSNSIFSISDKKCICTIEGQFMQNGVCIGCRTNQHYDMVAKKCICKPNFLSVNGNCVACPTLSTLNSDKSKCVCNEGYIWSQWRVSCIPVKCSANSVPLVSESGVKCNCKEGYFMNVDRCELIPKCPLGAVFNTNIKKCVCEKQNFYLFKGQCSQCPLNSAWNGTQCVCNPGYVNLNGVCTFLCGKNEVLENGKCVCSSKSILINKVCQECPVNSSPNKEKTLCNCNDGFRWDDSAKCCTKVVCPENSSPRTINLITSCVCNQGFIIQNSMCVQVGRCPVNSVWSQQKLCCTCTRPAEYMINNECRKCGLNQEWNERQRECVCSFGYNLIGNECKSCDLDETFNGVSCECNLGFYRNGLKCEPCDKSCGTCSGPANNQCLTCSDVTLKFNNGLCSKDSACPKGLFQRGASCAPCSTYCSDCVSESTCNSCIDGFQLESITYGGVTASYCVQKCGDGKRFQLDCDDGNNKNGDGCSFDCKVEAGWTCTGGSSTKSSTCVKGTPERTYLELTGTVHLYGRIVQGVRLSYIPEALAANDCAECYNLLWVRVIKSDIVPGVRVNYMPKSRFQFLVEFEFHGTFSIPTFNIAVQINPEYAKYFNRRDMTQIQIKTIDPSVLAMKDKEEELGLEDISLSSKFIKLPNKLVDQIFK